MLRCGLLSLLLLLPRSEGKPRLNLRPDGSFKMLIISDLHYGLDEEESNQTDRNVESLVLLEKPDLVVVNGDALSNYEWTFELKYNQNMWHRWTSVLNKLNQTYMYVLGNHDTADMDRNELGILDSTSPFSLTVPSLIANEGPTYVIPVYSSPSDDVVKLRIYAFDSDDLVGHGVYGGPSGEAVDWYRKTSYSINLENPAPAVAFVHTPLPEMIALRSYFNTFGNCNEEICCSRNNTRLFDAFVERKEVKAVFSGHDHNNAFYGFLHGIMMGYGLKSGYGGYGPNFSLPGGRVLIFRDGQELETYIINEKGIKDMQEARHIRGWGPIQLSCFCQQKLYLCVIETIALLFLQIGAMVLRFSLFKCCGVPAQHIKTIFLPFAETFGYPTTFISVYLVSAVYLVNSEELGLAHQVVYALLGAAHFYIATVYLRNMNKMIFANPDEIAEVPISFHRILKQSIYIFFKQHYWRVVISLGVLYFLVSLFPAYQKEFVNVLLLSYIIYLFASLIILSVDIYRRRRLGVVAYTEVPSKKDDDDVDTDENKNVDNNKELGRREAKRADIV